MNNKLSLKSIGDLLTYNFKIPSYQRGYRWKKDEEVKSLLEDIHSYEIDFNNPKAFYCLQPVVVKAVKENEYELIDGQQRLTTILLVLHYLFKTPKRHYSMQFETRIAQKNFLAIINDSHQTNDNIDLFYLNEAYCFIEKWFKNQELTNEAVKSEFHLKLVNKTKVIWYEIKDNTSVIDIFTRLNIGKIPLTNAELIKALFLSKSSNNKTSESYVLKQLSIATEWDKIEQILQQPDFWHFICNKPEKYVTHIEFIFDLMEKKEEDYESLYTFHQFYKAFEEDKDNPRIIENIWLTVKQYFLTFEEWYQDKELYHLVGYLVATGVKDVNSLKDEAQKTSKSVFKKYLKIQAKKSIGQNLDELNYEKNSDKPTIRKALLLFNILSIIDNEKSSIKFPFHYYNSQRFDIEHIRPKTSKDVIGKDRREWALTLLSYFTGIKWEDANESDIINTIMKLPNDEQMYCNKLVSIIKEDDKDNSIFSSLFDELKSYFKEADIFDDIDSLSNLTLLDEGTNRMYKNAFFPVKRKFIINREKQGVFIPLCTKNVFLKAYSQKLGDVMYWNNTDGNDYFNEISKMLQ